MPDLPAFASPSGPFHDPVAGESGYIDPATMRAFAQAIIDEPATISETAGYNYNTNTSPPPASGQLRMDAQPAGATKLYVANVDDDGVDVSAVLHAVAASGVVRVQDRDDATRWMQYNLAGQPVYQAGHVEFPMTVRSAGPVALAAQRVVVSFIWKH